MGAIVDTPRGGFKARYRDGHGRSRSKTFKRKGDARAFLASVETDKRRGDWFDERPGVWRFRSGAPSSWRAGCICGRRDELGMKATSAITFALSSGTCASQRSRPSTFKPG